jgi:Arc/MetJ-type ribon-helix-helix transcriptional regulator
MARTRSAGAPDRMCGVGALQELPRQAHRGRIQRACLPVAQAIGMMIRHTTMPKTKVALTLDSELLERVDELVDRRRFRNRSQAIEAALADKLERLARTRLARESAKLDPREEKRLADEGLAEDFASWPEY